MLWFLICKLFDWSFFMTEINVNKSLIHSWMKQFFTTWLLLIFWRIRNKFQIKRKSSLTTHHPKLVSCQQRIYHCQFLRYYPRIKQFLDRDMPDTKHKNEVHYAVLGRGGAVWSTTESNLWLQQTRVVAHYCWLPGCNCCWMYFACICCSVWWGYWGKCNEETFHYLNS